MSVIQQRAPIVLLWISFRIRFYAAGRFQLANNGRWFFIQLYRWFPSILQVLTIIRPETLVRWHKRLISSRPTALKTSMVAKTRVTGPLNRLHC
jgi:hypothetical protein